MPIAYNEISEKSSGGTELQARTLEKLLPPELLSEVQIIPSRVRKLDPDKIRILWCHDLPDDPESVHLKDGGWKKFHMIVFVSHWQAQLYIQKFNIPWDKTVVIRNAIVPLPELKKPTDEVRVIYHTTPHRGLEILVPVFEKLASERMTTNLHLDVFSSYSIYGWENRDKHYESLFDKIRAHPDMTYHGAVDNETVKQHVAKAHIFAYPSVWPETSCISLIEAMSGKCLCVHPDFAALPETAASWTTMYRWSENINNHAGRFYSMLGASIDYVSHPNSGWDDRTTIQKKYIDTFYSWDVRKMEWQRLLESLLKEDRALPVDENYTYRVG